MRHVVCHALGPVTDLVVEDAPDLEPGPGQVVVDVEAAGVNFVDALFVEGTYQIKPPLPFTPGGEVAGTVAAVGEGVEGWAVGDSVVATCGLGGYASQVLTGPSNLYRRPPGLDAPRGATVVQSYATAWFTLTRRTHVEPGEVVLVLGAGGGVGQASVDVARHLGAHVIAAAGSFAKLAAAQAMGAEATIDYESEDLKVRAKELAADLGRTGVDVVIDPVGDRHTEQALRATGWGGRLCVIGFAAGDIARLPANLALLNNRTIVGVDWGAFSFRHAEENRALLDEVFAAIGAGDLHPAAPTTWPLEQVADALTALQQRAVTGKVALLA